MAISFLNAAYLFQMVNGAAMRAIKSFKPEQAPCHINITPIPFPEVELKLPFCCSSRTPLAGSTDNSIVVKIVDVCSSYALIIKWLLEDIVLKEIIWCQVSSRMVK
jgi:hypothetical protein